MRRLVMIAMLAAMACAHKNSLDVEEPRIDARYVDKAGLRRNSSEVKIKEDDESVYARCEARLEGMPKRDVAERCRRFVDAGMPR